MHREIERKFLVRAGAWKDAPAILYRQGYLHADKDCTIRVRLAGTDGWLTIKTNSKGIGRDEYEYPIPAEDAAGLLACAGGLIVEKWRRVVDVQGRRWEVDEFLGANAGLVVAEIELKAEDEVFELPEWAGEEVTADARYSNSMLARHPFSTWR